MSRKPAMDARAHQRPWRVALAWSRDGLKGFALAAVIVAPVYALYVTAIDLSAAFGLVVFVLIFAAPLVIGFVCASWLGWASLPGALVRMDARIHPRTAPTPIMRGSMNQTERASCRPSS